MSETAVPPASGSPIGRYLIPFVIFAVLLALRESGNYGHVYDFLPIFGQSIPFFTLTVLLSLVYMKQGGSLKDLGLRWPGDDRTKMQSLVWIFFRAVLITIALVLSGSLVLELFDIMGSPRPGVSERMAPGVGNLPLLLSLMPVMWLVVLGEEILFRGFLMNFLARKLGSTAVGWILAILLSSLLFGLLHFWQGPRGMVGTGVTGLIFGTGYWLSKRNLWPVILAHIALNSVSFTSLYMAN